MSQPKSETESQKLARAKKELAALEEVQKYQIGLPHLFGWPWYEWAWDFYSTKNKEAFLTAANQASKSSTLIRLFISWATEPKLWKELWPGLMFGQVPNQFWYFYPTQEVATIEFESKWVPLFLPKNEFKEDPIFGWKEEYDKGMIRNIRFNSGVTLYFKSYQQKVANLQTGTVYLVGLDEECPIELLPEIQARLNSTDGYLRSVFTATLGQAYWEMTMERVGTADEKHVGAFKRTVSLYDCMKYKDGSSSTWTEEKINRAKARCPNEAEVLRRIYGKFVKSHGLMYDSFSMENNLTDKHPLPKHWLNYSGVDPGSGGLSGHPAAMIFLSVSPDFKHGRIFRGWRGDGIPTASSDILEQYRKLKGSMVLAAQKYDYAAKDFFLVASRMGESFSPADKARESGIGLLNTLFKNSMIKIHRGDPELDKLVSELMSLGVNADKRKASDDLCDALRYVVQSVPWDFSDIEFDESKAIRELPKEAAKTEGQLRREWYLGEKKAADSIEEEFDFFNEEAGS